MLATQIFRKAIFATSGSQEAGNREREQNSDIINPSNTVAYWLKRHWRNSDFIEMLATQISHTSEMRGRMAALAIIGYQKNAGNREREQSSEIIIQNNTVAYWLKRHWRTSDFIEMLVTQIFYTSEMREAVFAMIGRQKNAGNREREQSSEIIAQNNTVAYWLKRHRRYSNFIEMLVTKTYQICTTRENQ
jgi:N-acetyl-gamma-glutamylphosphate reductase